MIRTRTFLHDLRDIALPFALFIDIYYRTEWFYLHTTWGHVALSGIFGH